MGLGTDHSMCLKIFRRSLHIFYTVSAAKTGNTITLIYNDNGIGLPSPLLRGVCQRQIQEYHRSIIRRESRPILRDQPEGEI